MTLVTAAGTGAVRDLDWFGLRGITIVSCGEDTTTTDATMPCIDTDGVADSKAGELLDQTAKRFLVG
jgi:hypothetical protein